jgi:hypothetical protein
MLCAKQAGVVNKMAVGVKQAKWNGNGKVRW